MWKPSSLRSRLFFMLFALVFITVGGGIVSIWHTYMMEKFLGDVIDSELPSLQAAQELKIALVMQKGYVTYYFQDDDPRWLEQLDQYHKSFESWLKRARDQAETEKERRILNEIEARFIRYVHGREEVINLYRNKERERGFELQQKVREQLFNIISLCDEFKSASEERLADARQATRKMARTINELAMVALCTALFLGVVLGYTLIRNVLGPIRQFAMESGDTENEGVLDDEVKAVGIRLQTLMEDVNQTRSKLEWSKEHLQQAEKWAMVGKLAAGVAHSVRNPLTSVKMRLFSLERSLSLFPSQKEDFEVISEEIRHIDTIVNNFLDFARPPKLRMQMASPSDVVDMAIQLLRHRLESYNVSVEIRREARLPQIKADPDQLKEVLVNLMVNACEAMVNGGLIRVEETTSESEILGPVAIIRVSDNGPGVPRAIHGKLFQPFFSTKEEGTGLGLSIATRIVEEHGGWLDLESADGSGATFVITLPAGEEKTWGTSS